MVSSAEEKLRNIVAKVLLLDEGEVTDDLSRNDTDTWDSLAHLMLVGEVESAFEVTLSDDDVMAIKTVGDLKKLLVRFGFDM